MNSSLRQRAAAESPGDGDVEAASASSESVGKMQDDGNDHQDSDGLEPSTSEPAIVEASWRELVYHWFILGWTVRGGTRDHVSVGHQTHSLHAPRSLA